MAKENKHRGRGDRDFAPGSRGRREMTGEQAKQLEEEYPPITTDERFAQDARQIDKAYERKDGPDRRGKSKR